MSETTLDLSGLKCPLPALKTRKALGKLVSGEVLVVTATDPLASVDIPNLIRETGDILRTENRSGESLIFTIEKR